MQLCRLYYALGACITLQAKHALLLCCALAPRSLTF